MAISDPQRSATRLVAFVMGLSFAILPPYVAIHAVPATPGVMFRPAIPAAHSPAQSFAASAEGSTRAKTGNPIKGWEAGLTWVFIQSFVLMLGGFVGPIIRKITPRAALLGTLERYLADRRSVIESSRALFIHPNTLRQRLARIEELTGLNLDEDDLLSLELAIKLARLHGRPDAGR